MAISSAPDFASSLRAFAAVLPPFVPRARHVPDVQQELRDPRGEPYSMYSTRNTYCTVLYCVHAIWLLITMYSPVHIRALALTLRRESVSYRMHRAVREKSRTAARHPRWREMHAYHVSRASETRLRAFAFAVLYGVGGRGGKSRSCACRVESWGKYRCPQVRAWRRRERC